MKLKKVTLMVREETFAKAQILAAEKNTSITNVINDAIDVAYELHNKSRDNYFISEDKYTGRGEYFTVR